MTELSKADRYAQLVARRKCFDLAETGLRNPSTVDGGVYDSDHIGPWTLWAHDFNADLMVVGQDWGDVAYFRDNRGFDKPGNPTNRELAQLLESIGRPIPAPPSADEEERSSRATCGVWLTNALLFLKSGGMSALVKQRWFRGTFGSFLREQIDIVQPRAIVALGSEAYDAIGASFERPKRPALFRSVVESAEGVALPNSTATVFGVYHCGAKSQNMLRKLDQQREDWGRIGRFLRTV